jgi:hypothetical protein
MRAYFGLPPSWSSYLDGRLRTLISWSPSSPIRLVSPLPRSPSPLVVSWDRCPCDPPFPLINTLVDHYLVLDSRCSPEVKIRQSTPRVTTRHGKHRREPRAGGSHYTNFGGVTQPPWFGNAGIRSQLKLGGREFNRLNSVSGIGRLGRNSSVILPLARFIRDQLEPD